MNLIRRNTDKEVWDPFHILTDLREEMDRLFTRSLSKGMSGSMATLRTPEIDLKEDDHGYKIKADIPGIRKEDLDISISNNVLVLKGERKEETEKKEKGWHYSERWFGSFHRAVELPTEVDASKVKAAFKDGVLEIDLPKSEGAKPKQLKIEVK